MAPCCRACNPRQVYTLRLRAAHNFRAHPGAAGCNRKAGSCALCPVKCTNLREFAFAVEADRRGEGERVSFERVPQTRLLKRLPHSLARILAIAAALAVVSCSSAPRGP